MPAARPADILPCIGWAGACNHRTASELAVVLRSWEDRFGARLLEVGFDDIRLLVSRPPQTRRPADLRLERLGGVLHLRVDHAAHEVHVSYAQPARLGASQPSERAQQHRGAQPGGHHVMQRPYLSVVAT